MQVFIFGCMLITLFFGFLHKEKLTYLFLLITIYLMIHKFLYDVYDPVYGYTMPWLNI